MDTSSRSHRGCWRRCKSATPTKRMWKIYVPTFMNLVSCSRTSLKCFIMLSVYVSQFSSAFALTMLFPYLPFMVEFLLPNLEGDQQAIGKWYILNTTGGLRTTVFQTNYFTSSCVSVLTN